MIDDQVCHFYNACPVECSFIGQILTVTEFGLFSTTFRRVDGQEIIAPNTLLAR